MRGILKNFHEGFRILLIIHSQRSASELPVHNSRAFPPAALCEHKVARSEQSHLRHEGIDDAIGRLRYGMPIS